MFSCFQILFENSSPHQEKQHGNAWKRNTLPLPLTPSVSETEDLATKGGKRRKEHRAIEFFQT